MKARPEQLSAISRGVLTFFISLSVFIIVTSVLGCVGALKQHVKLLFMVRSSFCHSHLPTWEIDFVKLVSPEVFRN